MLVLAALGLRCGEVAAADPMPRRSSGEPNPTWQALLRPTIDAATALFRPRPRVVSIDHRVGSLGIDYVDPEFWPSQKRMVWQDRENNIWLCELNPQTGALVPADGRGQKLGAAARMIGEKSGEEVRVINSAEWGLSQRGLGVYFVAMLENGDFVGKRVSVPEGVEETLTPLGQDVYVGILPSTDVTDVQTRLLYVSPIENALIRYWQEEMEPALARPFPNAAIGSTGPRWIPGERAICTNVKDADGIKQIARYDIDTEVTTILTTGPGEKTDGFFFDAPEFGNERMFLCLIDTLSIGVFRLVDGRWTQLSNITPPRPTAPEVELVVLSNEPFTYRGRSYVSYGFEGGNQSAVCVASVDGRVNAVISTPSRLRNIDPEAVVLDDRLWVYYWTNQAEHAELHAVRVEFVR